MIEHYFIIHQIFKVLLAKRILFEIKIKCTNWIGGWLVIWEMKLLQIWMGKSLLYCNSILWIVGEHFLQ